MLMQALKQLNLERIDVHEAVALVAQARLVQAEYTGYGVTPPDFLTNAIGQLDGEIKRKRRDMLLARQREVAANLASLQTREEKKEALLAEQAALNDALGTTK